MIVPSLPTLSFAVPGFAVVVRLAVEEGGLTAAAILDAKGAVLAQAGAFDCHEARAIAAAVTHRSKSPDLLDRMLDGELITMSLGGREVGLGIAAHCMFIVVERGTDRTNASLAIDQLRTDVTRVIRDARAELLGPSPAPSGWGGSGSGGSDGGGSGPAELPLIEIGVTIPRGRN